MGRKPLPKGPCLACRSRESAVRGRCWRCYRYFKRHDFERPNVAGDIRMLRSATEWCQLQRDGQAPLFAIEDVLPMEKVHAE